MPNRTRNILMLVLFLDAAAMSMIIPALPHLLVDLTGSTFGEAAVLGGLLLASFALMLFLCGPLVGNLSDRYGRKPLMLMAIGANCLDFIILTLSPLFWPLFIGRILAGITGASFTVAGGFMADLTPKEERASAFGIVAGTFALGMVIGPAIGGYVAVFGIKAPFAVAALLSAINIVAIALMLPESLSKENRRPFALARANPVGAFSAVTGDPVLRRLVIAVLVFAIATQVFPVIWPYYTVEAFGFTPLMTGVSYTVLGLAMAASQGVLVKVSVAAISEVPTVRYAILCGMATLIALLFVTNGRVFLAMIPLIAVTFVVAPTIQGMMSNRMGEDRQGELMGLFASLTALSMMIGPILMSGVFQVFTDADAIVYAPAAPFALAAILMGLALYLFDVAEIRTAYPKPQKDLASEGE
ncbi:MFS transporter [Yoonia sp.]|uniref:MFS transporter n=1 Tax=Yoonia sp. TaxID=2212373 RepID=UPI00358EE908